MQAFISYLVLAAFIAVSLYALGGMIYMGFKNWKDDRAKADAMPSSLSSKNRRNKSLMAG